MKSRSLVLSLVVTLYSSGLLAQESKGFARLVVQKSGGMGAIQETYEITADGKYKISDLKESSKGQFEGDGLSAFVDAVNAVDWAELPRRSVASGSDEFLYTVAIITDNRFYSRTFHASVHAENAPLQAFLVALQKLE